MSLAEFESKFFVHRQAGDEGGITVVEIRPSHLTEEDNIEVFGNDLFGLVDQFDLNRIVIDCRNVVYATSSVLGKLITMHRKLRRVDGDFLLASVREEFLDVLQTSRLHTYFTIMDSVDAAVDQLNG